jgi:hypothetical protein
MWTASGSGENLPYWQGKRLVEEIGGQPVEGRDKRHATLIDMKK